MATQELNRLNHYPEFTTNAGIQNIIHFINNNQLPAGLNARQSARFQQKFGAGSGFVVIHGRLHYNPNAQINLEVVSPNQRQQKIQQIYDDPQRGLGVGLGAFYKQIALSYLNIPKPVTDAFLRRQSNYQVQRAPRRIVNKPVTSKVANERWAIDLIDMTRYSPVVNAQRKYIFTCVDNFSGRVWARGITNRNNTAAGDSIPAALASICNEANTHPRSIQGDSEFAVGGIAAWCRAHNIKVIKTLTYTPQSNGKIERMNQEIRKKTKAGFIKNNNFVWFAHLQDYVTNINNQVQARSKQTPNQLWTAGYNPHAAPHNAPQGLHLNDQMNPQQRRDYHEQYVNNRARDLLAHGRPPPDLHIGDMVRISLLKLSTKQRAARKNLIAYNKVAVHWSPEIYNVIAVHHNNQNLHMRRDEYELSDLNGNPVLAGPHHNKRFFGNDLQKVPIGHVAIGINPATVARAERLNFV